MNDLKTIGELTCTFVNDSPNPRAAVVLCHGFGASGSDLVPIAKEFTNAFPELAEMVFVFPQAPLELDPVFDSRAWWMIDVEKIQSLMQTGEFRELRTSKPLELPTLRLQLNQVVDELIKTHGLSPANIVVGGFSQGAMLATDVALKYPQPLGGLIVWSGTLLNESEWTTAAEQREPMSIIQSHGMFDPILPFAGAEFLRDMLIEHGHDVEFVPFEGEHTIGIEAMKATVKLLQSVL